MTRLGNIVAVSFLWFAAGMLHPHSAFAEWYVAGQFGAVHLDANLRLAQICFE